MCCAWAGEEHAYNAYVFAYFFFLFFYTLFELSTKNEYLIMANGTKMKIKHSEAVLNTKAEQK